MIYRLKCSTLSEDTTQLPVATLRLTMSVTPVLEALKPSLMSQAPVLTCGHTHTYTQVITNKINL